MIQNCYKDKIIRKLLGNPLTINVPLTQKPEQSRANQLTGFYEGGTLIVKGLRSSFLIIYPCSNFESLSSLLKSRDFTQIKLFRDFVTRKVARINAMAKLSHLACTQDFSRD